MKVNQSIRRAFDLLNQISVHGGDVTLMALAMQELRAAWEALCEEEKDG